MVKNDDPALSEALKLLDQDPAFAEKLKGSIDDLVFETESFRGEIEVAVSVTKDEATQLSNVFEHMLGKKLQLEFRVRPELLGGFRVKIGDWKYDASLLGQLEAMKEVVRHHG